MKNTRKTKILEFIGGIAITLSIVLLIYFVFFYNKSSIIQSSTTYPYTTISRTNPQVTITNPTNSQKSAKVTISNTTISQTKPQTTIYNPTISQTISQTKPQTTIYNPTITQITVKSPITFNAGQTGSWTVPEGVKQATFTVVGGNGGGTFTYGNGGIGGKGALITATISVYSGQIYNAYVGNNGIANKVNYSDDNTTEVVGGKSTVPESFGNGGNGSLYLGSGGSLSAVYLNKKPLFIAGGGGGAGWNGLNGLDSTVVSTSGSIDSSSNGADARHGGSGGGGLVGGIFITEESGDHMGNAGTSLVPTTPYTLGLSTGSPSITISW